jgi:hypothetical protein
MIDSALTRTLLCTSLLLIGAPAPASAAGDPAASCAAAKLEALGKACSSELSCHAGYAKSFSKDGRAASVRLDACLAKNEAKLTQSLDKVASRGGACALEGDAARWQAVGLATAMRLAVLTDWLPGDDAVDDALRSALLRASGRSCSQTLGAVAKQIAKPTEDGLETGLAKPLLGFVGAVAKATAKAEKAGGSGIETALLQAVVDNMRATAERLAPESDGPPREVFEVSSGDKHSCLLRTDNSVDCWGDNAAGQTSVPDEEFIAIAAGGAHTCGIRASDDQAECWGSDSKGQVSDAPDDELGFVIVAGGSHSCALRLDQTAVCWGDDGFGQSTPPVADRQYSSLSAGLFHTCGVRFADDVVDCWGDDFWGQSTTLGSMFEFRKVSAGGQLSCGVQIGSTLACWGSHPPPPGGIYFDVSAGQDFACALSSDDFTAECWGVPGPWMAPPDNETFTQISAGARHTCALRDTEGTVTCWGDDDEGQVSCDGVESCTGAAPPPCKIANEGPLFGKVGRITVTRTTGVIPGNDFRLIIPKDYLDVLRDVASTSGGVVASFVGAFDDRGFSCDDDDRIAIEFPAEDVEAFALLEQLGLLEPIIGFILDEIVDPIKEWYKDQILAVFQQWIAECLVELVIFQSSCV